MKQAEPRMPVWFRGLQLALTSLYGGFLAGLAAAFALGPDLETPGMHLVLVTGAFLLTIVPTAAIEVVVRRTLMREDHADEM